MLCSCAWLSGVPIQFRSVPGYILREWFLSPLIAAGWADACESRVTRQSVREVRIKNQIVARAKAKYANAQLLKPISPSSGWERYAPAEWKRWQSRRHGKALPVLILHPSAEPGPEPGPDTAVATCGEISSAAWLQDSRPLFEPLAAVGLATSVWRLHQQNCIWDERTVSANNPKMADWEAGLAVRVESHWRMYGGGAGLQALEAPVLQNQAVCRCAGMFCSPKLGWNSWYQWLNSQVSEDVVVMLFLHWKMS